MRAERSEAHRLKEAREFAPSLLLPADQLQQLGACRRVRHAASRFLNFIDEWNQVTEVLIELASRHKHSPESGVIFHEIADLEG